MPMLEQTKEIVHKFNAVYGETLTDPQILLPDNKACLRLPGTDGKAKIIFSAIVISPVKHILALLYMFCVTSSIFLLTISGKFFRKIAVTVEFFQKRCQKRHAEQS